jgi:parallel beta-helix repeat protein
MLWDENSGKTKDNKIYHNNFVNNADQVEPDSSPLYNAWDNGYPSGGNYWSDYNGSDLYHGSGQNLIGTDGIGDTAYSICNYNQDHYPLMGQWSLDTTAPTCSITNPTSLNWLYTTDSSIDLSGISSDNTGVTGVTWKNTATGMYGMATGTTSWSITSISLGTGNNGFNRIYVNASDGAGNVGSVTIDVYRDNTPPTVTIISPAVDPYYTSSGIVNLSGSMSDNYQVTAVTWKNMATGSSGTANCGFYTWSITEMSLNAGSNLVYVNATDGAGNIGSDIITIIRDNVNPTVAITMPTSSPIYIATTPYTMMSGTASDNTGVTSVTWVNSLGGFGTASGTTSWSIASIALTQGSNVINVTSHDASGNTASTTKTIVYDPTAPTITITSPTSNPTYSNGNKTIISLGGSASDNIGVTSITWSNAATGESGTANGTTSWTISGILLKMGSNVITVTAHDSAGNSGTDTITVNRTAPSWKTIYITSNSQFATQASNNGWLGNGTQSNPYVIYDYDINASSANGIDIRNTNVYFIIRGCNITSTTDSYKGIYISSVTNCCIEDTTVIHGTYGIYASSCTNTVLDSCSVTFATGSGMYIAVCNGVTITDCIASSNSNNGIQLVSCTVAVISGGEMSSNSLRGIYVAAGNNTVISGTQTSSNGYEGIYLTSASSVSTKNVTVSGVISTSNSRSGICLASCKYVTITGSNFSSNDNTGYAGIFVNTGTSVELTITENDLWNNYYGVYLKDSTNIDVYLNDFLSNTHQAYDNKGSENSWNMTGIGNHWSNWVSPDNNSDGIVDSPYIIDANSQDNYPLVSPYT